MRAGDWITLAAVLITGGGIVWRVATLLAELRSEVKVLRAELRAVLGWLGSLERRVSRRRK